MQQAPLARPEQLRWTRHPIRPSLPSCSVPSCAQGHENTNVFGPDLPATMCSMATLPMIDVRLTAHPVELPGWDEFPRGAGGECVFLGRTRPDAHPAHGELVRLSYQAYEPMAIAMLRSIAQEAVESFGCLAVRLHHALGDVPPGQASVLVQVATGHRGPAFDACRMLIDRLKAEAPIWKREQWADGTTWSAGKVVNA